MDTHSTCLSSSYITRDLPSFPTRRSSDLERAERHERNQRHERHERRRRHVLHADRRRRRHAQDRKSTRLNSSHTVISYAVFCLKKKKKQQGETLDAHTDLDAVR